MRKDNVQVNFRLPQELKQKLENSAQANGRSITSELIVRLDESFDDKKQSDDLTQLKLDQILTEIQSLKNP